VRWLIRGWLMLVGGTLLTFAGVTAHGAWRALSSPGVSAERTVSPAAQPLAAPSPLALAMAAPARGVTGTIALPDMPVPDLSRTLDTGVVAARPFSLAGVASTDRGRALECLTAAIYYEAASESDAGQAAVAQVVLNRVRHPAFPASVCGVVYQGSERAGCQFSFACDGAMARVPSRGGWARATATAAMALGGYVQPKVGLATHYHTYAVTPAWNRSLVLTDMIGAHLFHRWKGWWGTAPAFRQRYAGAEPVPGPHPRVTTALILPIAGATPLPTTDLATVRAPYVDSGATLVPRVAAAPADPLPDSGQVLDKWKDSGQPIR
jgi:hypothetical protein